LFSKVGYFLSNLKTGKKILITGGTGLLGVALQRSAPQDIQGFSIYFPERSLPLPLPFPIRAADVSDRREMQAVFEWAQPEVVIHTAAIGSVDYAEKNRDETRKVNRGGTEIVVELCQIFKSRLIYISSNAIFDGRTPFYSETAPLKPINYYGQLKVEAERAVRESSILWAIVRPILMYGWPYPGERDNPVVWWVRSLENGQPIKVVDNVLSKPLPAWSCAEAVWAVIRQNRTGIYHVAGRDHISLYSYFPEIAPRPQDTSFDTTKMETELEVKPVGVRDGLLKMKAERPARL
jgi:dTDP-4-dehydrorhamnose reductase